MSDFTRLVDLASERLGGRVLAANDEFFAPKENLLKPTKPIFIEGKYTDRGKWMDGWETRRRRSPGYDWCIVRLGLAGIVRGVVVDTSYFRGNFPEHCSMEACALKGLLPPKKELAWLADAAAQWIEILPQSPLKGDTLNLFTINAAQRFTHLRFKIYPDGGVARLRVHGEVVPEWNRLLARKSEIDLAAVQSGGRILASSDEFFSSPMKLLMPGQAKNMGDGWETRRRRGPGHDWVIVKLGMAGTIQRVEVDTFHFKGNFPESCSLDGCNAEGIALKDMPGPAVAWKEVLPRTKLKANSRHALGREIRPVGPVTHVRFNIFPDGGVSRLRIYGAPTAVASRSVSESAKMAAGLRRFNKMSAEEATTLLFQCCGLRAWTQRMVARRPFRSAEELFGAADRIWSALDRQDWLEAFRHHPKIGETRPRQQQSAQARRWAEREQSSVRDASAEVLVALAEANRAYQARFGYIFIVCATGKSSEEMLRILQQRLSNDSETELRIAAEEQRKITRLRLEKVLRS